MDGKVTRYQLLSSGDIMKLPALKWRVKGVLPDAGIAGLYGPSGSGKSFLALDLGMAIAEGIDWFGCRVKKAPVVYCVLEGEGGIKQRLQAWEVLKGRKVPRDMFLVLQNFKLTDPQDLADMVEVIPEGAVVFIDTLNRAVPGTDENSSKDMGIVLSAAKLLQSATKGMIVIVHHTGKDKDKGLRGHSSLLAALDASIEVSREGDFRDWSVAKSKDGQDGVCYPFKLEIQLVGKDDDGDDITSCIVNSGMEQVQKIQCNLPKGANQQAAYDAIVKLSRDGVVGIPDVPEGVACVKYEAALTVATAVMDCLEKRKKERAKAAIQGLLDGKVVELRGGWVWVV